MRFTISGMYLAAVTISDDDDPEGDWYTTITDEASERLPFSDHASVAYCRGRRSVRF